MQYLVLIYENEQRFANGFSETEFAEYGAFGKKHASAIKGGNALQPTPTAKTVRVRDSKMLTTDGPFAETKEQLGGYYLIEAPGIDEATSIAAGIPAARYGSIEVGNEHRMSVSWAGLADTVDASMAGFDAILATGKYDGLFDH